ncbi:TVP38/TMEM64 family protein [Janibacter sp. GS2]|uniref:TVP38/TMEM64 family protein n=1 Tax=Janibacter sp. GS2 TaxID=3442646 RepID=UPI003EB7E047
MPFRRARRDDLLPDHGASVRLLALVAVLVVAGVIAAVVGPPDVERVQARIDAAGHAAPVLFVLIYAVVTLLPLPKNVVAALAGAMFGLALGVVVVFLAALLGAAAAFALSRALGRDAVERLTGARVARVDALLGRRGITAVIGVRLVPILPFTVINYSAGLTAVRTRDYAIGTAVGIVPGTVSYVALGAFGTTPGSWPFLLSAAALIVLTGGGFLVARTLRRDRTSADPLVHEA